MISAQFCKSSNIERVDKNKSGTGYDLPCCECIDEVEKKSKAIKEAEAADVHVVDEEFLDKVQKGGAALLISQHSIASWGSDVSLHFMNRKQKQSKFE